MLVYIKIHKTGKGWLLSRSPGNTSHAGSHGEFPSRNKANCAIAIDPKAGYDTLLSLMSTPTRIFS